jgi:hypothetical protein
LRRFPKEGRDGDEQAAYAAAAGCNGLTRAVHWAATSIRR